MSDYGPLYQSRRWKALFPEFEKLQREAADQIWTRVLGRCGVDVGLPPVDFIVDLGCGEGALTTELAKRNTTKLSKRGNPAHHAIEIIGIDRSKQAIKLAKRKHADVSKCKFIHWADGFVELFDHLTKAHNVAWERTALVCLGHTWFHLDQKSLQEAVCKHRPVLLLVDIFHTWDETIRKLRLHDNSKPVIEFGRKFGTNTYWLKTERLRGNKLRRGIWRERGGWLFETEQHDLSTEELWGKVPEKDASNVLATSRKMGVITGEDGCDYVMRKVIRHSSGWGEMLLHALVRRNRDAVALNEAYFPVVSRIIKRLFVNNETMQSTKVLRGLLDLYNEDSGWLKKTKLNGSREAMIVLPFDPHTSFARIVGLFVKANDSEISKHDLIVEAPTSVQLRFPTAYGLFHTLEARTSSPQAFPLEWAPDYEHSEVDVEFGTLENRLLGLSGTDGKPTENDREVGYFLLPVYFGSLPLFCLALRFPQVFPAESTDHGVYSSALVNLHSEIKLVFTDDFIRSEVIRPWANASLNATSLIQSQPELEDRVRILEKLLFGSQTSPRTISDESSCGYELAGQQRFGGVLGKDWKSWVLGIPSYSIKKLRSVIMENTRLWHLWAEEKELILKNHERRLSDWFQQGRFFIDAEDGGHDWWLCKKHLARLHRMFQIAGFQVSPLLPNNNADDSWLVHAIAKLKMLQTKPRDSMLDGSGYFAKSRGHFLFEWMTKEFAGFVEHKPLCEFKQCHPESGSETNCSRHATFENLKAVFCKSLANQGDGIRFGMRRLFCLVEAACGDEELVTPRKRSFKLWESAGLESKYWSDQDVSFQLSEFVFALRCLGRSSARPQGILEAVTFRSFDDPNKPVTLEITITSGLNKQRAGSDCESALRSFQVLRERGLTRQDFWNNRTFTLSFFVKPTAPHGIAFSAPL